MRRGKAVALENRSGVAAANRPQNGGQSGLAPAVFGIEQRQLRKWDLRACADRIELADITHEMDVLNQGCTPSGFIKPRIAIRGHV